MESTDKIQRETFLESKNNRPIRDAINNLFTYNTIKKRGNQVKYFADTKTNELIFEEGCFGRATVFMKKDIVDLSVEGELDWITLYTDPVGYKTFGFYAKDPSRLGYICFSNYTLGAYEFEPKRPEFSRFSSEKARFIYDGEGWSIYDEDEFLGKITPDDFVTTSKETSEMIPMLGFKIGPDTTLPHSIKIKGYKKITDDLRTINNYSTGSNYTKTEWVEYETLVSADSLNNIEEGLEFVSNKTSTLSSAIAEHANNEEIHIASEEKQVLLDNAKEFSSHKSDEAAHGIGDKSQLLTKDKSSIVSAVNELFTNVSDGKKLVGTAITDIDNSLVVPTEPTFQDLANAVGQISTGKKWASGTITSLDSIESYTYGNGGTKSLRSVTVTGLDFKPSIIIVRYAGSGSTPLSSFVTIYMSDGTFFNTTPESKILMTSATPSESNVYSYTFQAVSPAYVSYGKFKLPTMLGNTNYTWIAFE